MNKFALLIFFSCFFVLSISAQSRHTIFFNNGYTFNNSIELNGEPVQDSRGYNFNLGLMYRVFTSKVFNTEIGLAGKTIFSTGLINNERFNARTLRLAMPIKFIIPITSTWTLGSGFRFQNNVDVSEFDIRLRDKYSWRVDFITEARYFLNKQWYLSIGISANLRTLPDSYVINDPTTAIFVGIAKPIHLIKNKKNSL